MVIYERNHLSRPDQTQRNPVSARRVNRIDLARAGTAHAENRRSAGRRCLVFLPVLLLRVLRDRTLRGWKL